ncbi:hypothetical protein G4177_32290 [Corallococcus sp. ZKHCc1 1396]|uniref:3-oxoacyl-ACP synthase n=1 Tax=Corallococcus soli TaxID=2710757 RepID=A0ABR9PY28_9BACT|nr:hypothetical protein [Corallococcus soli]MBE4752841.1 hypothetical protein [Corallococcus soli]
MNLAITSLGMICSVGYGAAASCAAIRAGIARPRELESFRVTEGDPANEAALMGHPVEGYTEGYSRQARWLRLALGSLAELRTYGGLPDPRQAGFWKRTGLVAALPWPDEEWLELAGGSDVLARQAYLEPLIDASRLPISIEHTLGVWAGHAGTIEAVGWARTQLSQRRMDRVVVLAADSYLDQATLDELLEQRRLKSGDVPCGMAPGEAAACFLLEPETDAQRRGARIEARIRSVGMARCEPFDLQGAHDGAALSRATAQALEGSGLEGLFDGDLHTDLNGENWRARQVSYLRLRLDSRLSPRSRLLTACTSLGDVGAASGAVSVCAAVRAWRRGHAGGPHSLVVSISDRGHCGAMVLEQHRS